MNDVLCYNYYSQTYYIEIMPKCHNVKTDNRRQRVISPTLHYSLVIYIPNDSS